MVFNEKMGIKNREKQGRKGSYAFGIKDRVKRDNVRKEENKRRIGKGKAGDDSTLS